MDIVDWVREKYGEGNLPENVNVMSEWHNAMMERFDKFLYGEMATMLSLDRKPVVKAIKSSEVPQEIQGEGKVYFITFTINKGEAEPIIIVNNMVKAALNSKLFRIVKYCYGIEKGDDNDNWHAHMLCRCVGMKNGKRDMLPYDKIKKLKMFKDRRIDFKLVPSTEKDLYDTLKYVCKDAGKYPEVIEELGGNIFANFNLPFKDMVYIKNEQLV